MKTSNNLRLTDVTKDNFSDFKQLVEQQAVHHLCSYSGNDANFFNEISDPQSPAHVIIAWDSTEDKAMGYVLYNVMHGLKGKEIYIEDILVRQDVRSHGVGSFFFDQLKAQARTSQVDAISWVVARNNDRAIDFYTKKQQAKAVNVVGYDCTGILSSEFNKHAAVSVHSICANDIAELAQMASSAIALTSEKVRHLQDAYDQPHVEALMARDIDNNPLALLIANSNYSSFRTVYGYKVELMELTDNAEHALKAMNGLVEQISKHAKHNAHDGHLNIFINPQSQAQNNLISDLGGEEFMMSDHSNSYLDLYTIDRSIIHNLNSELSKLDNVYQIDSFAKAGKFIIR